MAVVAIVSKQLAFPFAIQYLKPEFEAEAHQEFFAPSQQYRTPLPQPAVEAQAA